MKKTCFSLRPIIVFVALLCVCAVMRAANFTTAVQQGSTAPTSNWFTNNTGAGIWLPGNVLPAAGNTYEVVAGGNPSRIRNPTYGGSTLTFPGDSLQLNTNAEIRGKTATTPTTINFPGVGGNPGLILNGGNLDVGDNAVLTITGIILVQNPSSFSCGDSGGNNTRGWKIAAEIRGATNIDVSKYFGNGANAMELTGVNNPFTGTWIFRSGGFKATGSGSLGDSSILLTPTNAVVNPVVFEPMYDVVSQGKLTITNGGKVNLHQNCSWTAVTIGGTPLTVGTHPFSELSANFPTNFVAGGSGSITVAAPAPPLAPLNISAVNGDTQVALSWSPALNAASYFVNRSSTSGGPYTNIGSTGTTNFTDTGLVNGTTNYYVIVATNNLGASTNSSEVVGIPNVVVVGIIAAGGTNQVLLNWSALANAASYTVLRATSGGGPFTLVASGVVTTTYLDTTVQSGTVYFYRIAAPLNDGGQSGQSATVNATTAPSTPVLNVVRFASTVIRLGWTSPDTANRQFFIERSQDGTNFSFLAVQTNPLSYTNTGLALSNTYYYRVQASNITGLSAYSNIASTNTPPTTGYNINFGSAPDASAGTLNSPTPVGYLNDTGGVFGARGNGFNYGWSNNFGLGASTNMGRDTRWRVNPISPDLRYDTFVHLMKANVNNPAQGAIWEFEIPNGPYIVHIVAGDADNGDPATDRFQFDVEGVVTPLFLPGTATPSAHWGDFVTSVAVSDGRLTIKSGPLALNNKITFVDIYPDIPVPPVISVNPVSQTNEQNRAVSLSVTLSQGSPRLDYQWYFNSNLLAGATNSTLNIAHVQLTDQGEYYLVVTNYGGAATSAVATLTVTPDTTPPFLISAGSLNGTTIGVCFNEEMDTNTLGDFSNYSINGGAIGVLGVIARPDGRSAIVLVEGTVSGSFTVEASSVVDLAGQFSDFSQASGTVLGFTVGDVGAPQFAGSNFTCDGTNIDLVGGGVDYWAASDQAYLATKSVSGDFDTSVRVTALAGGDPITKALLIARETLNADSAGVHVSVNPVPPGRNQMEMGVRSTTGSSTVAMGTFVPAGVPNAWMRITRVGNLFTSYRSTNGVDWILLGQTNQPLATSLVVGLAMTAHNNSLLATGTFSNFSLSQSASSDLAITKVASTNSVRRGQHVSYFITVSNRGPDAATGVVVADAISAGGNFVSASPSQGSISGATTNSFTWNAGTLAANSSATCGVYVTTYAVGSFTNSASATSANIDPNPGNNFVSVAVQVLIPSNPVLVGASFSGGIFSGSFQTEAELTYEVQYSHAVAISRPCPDFTDCGLPPVTEPWFTLTNIVGDGALKTFTDPNPAPDRRFYRTLVH